MTPEPKTADQIEELIEQGQALVISLASRIRTKLPFRIDIEDLIGYGEIGLAEAAQDFDSGREVKFTTFAFYRVRGAMYDGVSKMSWTSRARYRRMRFEQMSNEYLAQDGKNPPDAANPEGGSFNLEAEAKWLRNTTDKLAVIFFASHDDGEGGICDWSVEDDTTAPAPSIVAQREITEKLHELVNSLPNIEERLIRKVYFEGATLQEAGNSLGMSKSWASRLHAKALESMGRAMRRIGVQD